MTLTFEGRQTLRLLVSDARLVRVRAEADALCEWCGESYEYTARHTAGTQRYCSRSCSNAKKTHLRRERRASDLSTGAPGSGSTKPNPKESVPTGCDNSCDANHTEGAQPMGTTQTKAAA